MMAALNFDFTRRDRRHVWTEIAFHSPKKKNIADSGS